MNLQAYLVQRFPAGGYFMEAGAHDGVGDSQTFALEQLGWRGLCVEPSSAFKGLAKSRTCSVDNRAVGAVTGEKLVFREVLGGAIELSGLLSHFGDHWDRETRPHRDRVVTTVSLTDVLAQHRAPPVIEFLSLDTEGSELAILTAHDFDAYKFAVIAVEHNGVQAKRDGLRELLAGQGYKLLEDDETNLIMELP